MTQRYCYGSYDGRKHDRGIKIVRGKRVYVCGCGRLLPTPQMARRNETRRRKLEREVKELRRKLKK